MLHQWPGWLPWLPPRPPPPAHPPSHRRAAARHLLLTHGWGQAGGKTSAMGCPAPACARLPLAFWLACAGLVRACPSKHPSFLLPGRQLAVLRLLFGHAASLLGLRSNLCLPAHPQEPPCLLWTAQALLPPPFPVQTEATTAAAADSPTSSACGKRGQPPTHLPPFAGATGGQAAGVAGADIHIVHLCIQAMPSQWLLKRPMMCK